MFNIEGTNINKLTNKKYKNLEKMKKIYNFPIFFKYTNIVDNLKQNKVVIFNNKVNSKINWILPQSSIHSMNYKGIVFVCVKNDIIAKYASKYLAKISEAEWGKEIGFECDLNFENKKSFNRTSKIIFITPKFLIKRLIKMLKNKKFINQTIIINDFHNFNFYYSELFFYIKNIIKNYSLTKLAIVNNYLPNEELLKNYLNDFNPLISNYKISIKKKSDQKISYINTNNYLKNGINISIKYLKSKRKNTCLVFYVKNIKDSSIIFNTLIKLNKKSFNTFIIEINKNTYLQDYNNILTNSYLKLKNNFGNYIKKIIISTSVSESESLIIKNVDLIIDCGIEEKVLTHKFDSEIKKIVNISITKRKSKIRRTKLSDNGKMIQFYKYDDLPDNYQINFKEYKLVDYNINIFLNNIEQNIKKIKENKKVNLHSFIDNFKNFPIEVNSELVEKNLEKLRTFGFIDIDDNPTPLFVLLYYFNIPSEYIKCIIDSIILDCYKEISYIIAFIQNTNKLTDIFVKLNRINIKYIKSKFNYSISEHINIINLLKFFDNLNNSQKNKWCLKYHISKNLLYSVILKKNKLIKQIENIKSNYNNKYIMDLLGYKKNIVENIYQLKNDKTLHCLVSGNIFRLCTKSFENVYKTNFPNKIINVNLDNNFNLFNPNIKDKYQNIFFTKIYNNNNKNNLNLISFVPQHIIKNVYQLKKSISLKKLIDSLNINVEKDLQNIQLINERGIEDTKEQKFNQFEIIKKLTEEEISDDLFISQKYINNKKINQLFNQFSANLNDINDLDNDFSNGLKITKLNTNIYRTLIDNILNNHKYLVKLLKKKTKEKEKAKKIIEHYKNKLENINNNLEKMITKLEIIKKQLNDGSIKFNKIKNLNFEQVFDNHEKSKEIKIKTKALSTNLKKNDHIIKLTKKVGKKYKNSMIIYNQKKKELDNIKLELFEIYNNLKYSQPRVN